MNDFRRWAAATLTSKGRRRPARARRTRLVPRLDVLEGRALLSTRTVTTAADAGPGSLRRAVLDSAPGGLIVFDPGLNGSTIVLANQVVIDKDLTIEGPGADKLAISGGGASRVFLTAPKTYVTIAGLTIANGSASQGGGILAAGNGLTLTGDVFRGDTAAGTGGGDGQGGAIYQSAGS